jgi:hypothetical protein
MAIWNIFGRWVIFLVIWYSFHVLVHCTTKNLASHASAGFIFKVFPNPFAPNLGDTCFECFDTWQCGDRVVSFHRLAKNGFNVIADAFTWGRCYDHNFLQFFPIFGEKIGVFLNTNVMITFMSKFALFPIKNDNFFDKFFGENILKIITLVPGTPKSLKYLFRKLAVKGFEKKSFASI